MSETNSISTLSRESEAALSRSLVYSFLARAFLYPQEPLEDYLDSAQESLQWLGLTAPAARLESLRANGLSLEEGRADYVQVFGHTVNPDFPQYESEYGNTSLYQQSGALGDIAAFYRSCGLESRSEERLDHIGVELEFMYFLTFKEAYAWQHHGPEKAEVCRLGQKRFVETHLGCWAPLFLRLLMKKTESPFYRDVAGIAQEFVAEDVKLLGGAPRALAETDFDPRKLSEKREVAWEVKDCSESCI